jgi:hypothetical protein
MHQNTLGNNEWLLTGNSLWSNDSSVEFKMRGDGKIAVYWGGKCQWQNTPDQKSNVKGIKMHGDGNLCMWYVNLPLAYLFKLLHYRAL